MVLFRHLANLILELLVQGAKVFAKLPVDDDPD